MKNKAKILTWFIFFLTICLIFITIGVLLKLNSINPKVVREEAVNGVIILDDNEIKEKKLVMLNGEWEFYPNEFYTPEDFMNSKVCNRTLLQFPGSWDGVKNSDGMYSTNGYGTYRLIIKSGKASSGVAMLISAAPAEAYRVYVNGEEAFSVGYPGISKEKTIREYKTELYSFSLRNETEIIIHTCNHSFTLGGFFKSIVIGDQGEVVQKNIYNLCRDYFYVGVLITILLYFGLIWFLNKESIRSEAYIVMVSLLSIFYTVSNNEMLIRRIFLNVPFKVYNVLFYSLPICGTSFYIFMLCHLFPEESFHKLKKITIFKALFFMSINIFLPIYITGKIINVANVIAILEFMYGLYVISKVIIKKKEYGISLAIGSIALIVSIIYDILQFNGVITTLNGVAAPIGLSVYILCYAVSIGRKYDKSYKIIRALSVELQEKDKIKDEFLANTSHELKTPINSIIAITNSLIEQGEGEININQKESLSLIISSGKRLNSLINDILDYSRLKEGKLSLIKSEFDLSKAIENILKEFKPVASKKNICISSDMDEALKAIYADKYRMIQVVYNIIGNAVKFSPLNGNIFVSGYEEDNTVIINIQDNGIGIEKDKLHVIFNVFEQGNYSITKKYEGVGLGLSISKQIVEAHGGDISVVSEVGKGSIFTIKIPKIINGIEENNLEVVDNFYNNHFSVEKEDHIIMKGKRKETIVIIDDNFANIFGIANILKTEDYSMKGFVNAKEGMEEIFQNKEVVLAIIDLMMPDISGYEVTRRIRERFMMTEIPILIMTARMQTDSIIKSFKVGANDFLSKPFESEELKSRVNTLVALKKVSRDAINSEIALLHAQIKPHFLYNTMNSIAACCYEDSEKAADIIINLANYLRHTFDYDVNINEVPLSKEIKLIKEYLYIEKIRYDDLLEYEIVFKEEESIIVPPFSIQTLVENAVNHGIIKKANGGKVTIKGSFKAEIYEITVEDNGVGIKEETLKEILSEEKQGIKGVGIYSVQKRIKAMHGTDIEIISKYGKGTKIILKIRSQ